MENEKSIEKVDLSSYQEDDDDNYDEELMPKALPLEGDPIPPNSQIPSDANEYLRQVRWEAEHYENNFVATNLINVPETSVNHNYGPNSYLFKFFQPNSNQKKGFLDEINSEWKKKVVDEFSNLKQVLIFLISVIFLGNRECSNSKA